MEIPVQFVIVGGQFIPVMAPGIADDNNLPAGRSGHVATQLNGKMIVWGGFGTLNDDLNNRISEKYIASNILWIYDIEAQKWTRHFANGPMKGQSGSGSFNFCGKVYVWGGYPHHSKQMFVLDPAVGTWQNAQVEGDPPEYRDKFVSWFYEDRYIIFGGFGPVPKDATRESWVADPSSLHFNVLRGWNNQLFEYNIGGNRWSTPQTRGPVPCPRASHAGAVVGNRGYVFGGRFQDRRRNDIHFLDLDTYSWSDRLPVQGPQPEGRSWHSLTAVGSHHLLLCGGFNTACKPLEDVWMFDTNNYLWKRLEWDLPSPRLWHTAVQGTHLGEVVIFGGTTNNILSMEEPTRHTNSVLHIFVAPKTLFRICCDMIRMNLEHLRPQLNQLPSYLQKKFDQNPMPR